MTRRDGARNGLTIVADMPSPHQNAFFEALSAEGFDVEVFFCRRKARVRHAWKGVQAPTGVRSVYLWGIPCPAGPLNPGLLPRVIARRRKLVLLIGYYLPGMAITALFLGFSRRDWVFWTDTLPDPKPARSLKDRVRNFLLRFCLNRSSLVLTTGEAGLSALRRHDVGVDRGAALPFVVNHDSIVADVEFATDAATEKRKEFGFEERTVVFLFVGQLIQRKGVDVLLDGLRSARDRGVTDFGLVVVGEGEDQQRLIMKALELDLGSRCFFLGTVGHEELPVLWAASDAFVLPSRFDPWPVVVLEACAAGLPVIGTSSSGSVQDCISSESGWIVGPDDSSAMADAVSSAYHLGRDRLRKMGSVARRDASQRKPGRVAQEFRGIMAGFLESEESR